MFPVEQSAFLHALGYAIGHSLWQMPLLWFAYYGAIRIKNISSGQRYALSVSACISGTIWFVLTLAYYSNQFPNSADTSNLTLLSYPAESTSKNLSFFYRSAVSTIQSLAPYISCAYLAVLLVLGVRLANGFRQVRNLRTKGIGKPEVHWRLFVNEHAALLGIAKPVKVFISEIASSPLTIGFWKPIILIPLASMNNLTLQQMEAVLLHELAHIRRHDYFINIILQFAEIILFFNPFMRLLLKQARQERENSCDDWVLQFKYNASDYARALLCIEQNSAKSLLALGSNNKNEFELLKRVKRMVAPEREAFNYRQQLGLLLVITLLSLGFTAFSPHSKKSAAKKEHIIAQATNRFLRQKSNPHQAAVPPRIAPSPPVGIDLVQQLVDINEINKMASSKDFQNQCEQLEKEAAMVNEEVSEKSRIYVEDIKRNAEELAQHFKITPEMEEKWAAMSKDAARLNLAQFYSLPIENTQLEKLIAPTKELSAKALGSLPALFQNWEWKKIFVQPPPPPDCEKNVRQAEENARRAYLDAQREQLASEKNHRRIATFTDTHLGTIFVEQNEIIKEEKALAEKRARLEKDRRQEVAVIAPRVLQNYNYSYAVGTNNTNIAWNNNETNAEDEEKDQSVEELGESSCPKSYPRRQAVAGALLKGLNPAEINNELENAQDQLIQVFNSDIQFKISAEEIKEWEKNSGKLDIKAHITTQPGTNGRIIVIEVQKR